MPITCQTDKRLAHGSYSSKAYVLTSLDYCNAIVVISLTDVASFWNKLIN